MPPNAFSLPPPPIAASAPTPSTSAAADPPPSADDGIPQIAWLREMREMRHEAQREREMQTKAFVAAVDRLGTKMDANAGEMRVEMRRYLSFLAATFVVSLVVLASLAGATVYIKGFGVTASTEPTTLTP